MPDDNNHILEKIDGALRDPETPRWVIPVLMCIRDDHKALHDHLASERSGQNTVRQVATDVIKALAMALVLWLLAGRLPAIFGP